MTLKRILIVDDDVAVTNYLMVFLMQTERFETRVENDSRKVAGLLEQETFDCLLLDMDMPNVSGIDIMNTMRARGVKTPVVILTGVSDVEVAVRAMKLSAFDYLTKPVDEEHLLEVIDSAIEHQALHYSIEQLPSELKREDLAFQDAFAHIPTQNPAMIRLLHQAETLAPSNLSIFIFGERGTGKELLARAIHNASPARRGAFVVADASAQEPEAFPAVFFGQGARWGGAREEHAGLLEEAEGGTLYLCEIERLTLPMQVRLKRVLQTGESYRENSTDIRKHNVRFVVSSSQDLTGERYRDAFSQDLVYHLMINSLHVPPLRERREDIAPLLEFFLAEGRRRIGREVTGFSPDFVALLMKYDFPDNVQELRNIVEASMVNADGPVVTVAAMPPFIRQRIMAGEAAGRAGFQPRPMTDVQREHARRMLSHFGNDRERAAREMGVTAADLDAWLAEE
jgi:DNA-binding NtrC family response regulator